MIARLVRNAYERLFCAFYLWSERINGRESFNVYYASLMVGLALLVNAASILMILEVVVDRAFLQVVSSASTVFLAPLVIIYFLLHYYYFKRADRYKIVVEAQKNNERRPIGKAFPKFGITYAVVSMLVFFVLLFLRLEQVSAS